MHTDDLLELDRHQKHEPKQDLVWVVWRRRMRVGEDGGECNPDGAVDVDGLSGEETGVFFRLVNAEAVRRTGEFIFSFFSFTSIFCDYQHNLSPSFTLLRPLRCSVCGLLAAKGVFTECTMMGWSMVVLGVYLLMGIDTI
jgi:hypothetical protein